MFMKHSGIIDGLGQTIIVEESQATFDAIYAPRGWVTATQGEADAYFGAPNPDDTLVTKVQLDTAIAGSVGSLVAPFGTTPTGATADGTTDDSTALQSFLNSTVKGVVAPGTYAIASALTIPATVKALDMRGVTLKVTAAISGAALRIGTAATRLDDAEIWLPTVDCNNLADNGFALPYAFRTRLHGGLVKTPVSHYIIVGDVAAADNCAQITWIMANGDRPQTGTASAVPSGSIGLWVRRCTDSDLWAPVMIGADISFQNDGATNRIYSCHGWGKAGHPPSKILKDTGTANTYYSPQIDSPSVYGVEFAGTATRLVQPDFYMNSSAGVTDNTAIAMYSAGPVSLFRVEKATFRGSAGARWLKDADGALVATGSGTRVPASGFSISGSYYDGNMGTPLDQKDGRSDATYWAGQMRHHIDDVDAETWRTSVGTRVVTLNTTNKRLSMSAGQINGYLSSLTTETFRLESTTGAISPGTASGLGVAIYSGTGAPALSAALNDVYVRKDAGAGTWLYRCTTAGSATTGAWTAVL